jgi:hypothetical protein
MTTTDTVTFRGHTHIKVEGNALAPPRMWTVKLYTREEFEALPPAEQALTRELRPTDARLIYHHFGATADLEFTRLS